MGALKLFVARTPLAKTSLARSNLNYAGTVFFASERFVVTTLHRNNEMETRVFFCYFVAECERFFVCVIISGCRLGRALDLVARVVARVSESVCASLCVSVCVCK